MPKFPMRFQGNDFPLFIFCNCFNMPSSSIMGWKTLGNIFSLYYLRNLVNKMKTSNMDFLHSYHFFFVRKVKICTLVKGMSCVECQVVMRPPGSNKLYLL